jgi:hypothetical protein
LPWSRPVVELREPGDEEGELLGDVDRDEVLVGDVGPPMGVGKDDGDDCSDAAQQDGRTSTELSEALSRCACAVRP